MLHETKWKIWTLGSIDLGCKAVVQGPLALIIFT